MIEVNISKRIKTFHGLSTLKIENAFLSGSITQVLGVSGIGKTTFLKILAGLIMPESGRIVVDGQTWFDGVGSVNLSPQIRKVGFVFQDYALFPHMTVKKHMTYGTSDNDYVRTLLEMGKMEPYLGHKPKELSGGQQQRLAILRALSTKPRILLMDEPFSALDKALRASLMQELKLLIKTAGITCVIVTHDPFAAGEFADETFEMK